MTDPRPREGLLAAAAEAAKLTWRAAPCTVAGQLVLTVCAALIPTAGAWLTKRVLDALSRPGAAAPLTELAVALAGIGLAAAGLPQLNRYLGAELGRSLGVQATDRLFTATDRFVGLVRYEDPKFLDRLRMAAQSAARCDQLVACGFDLSRGAITLIAFSGALLAISPAMLGVVLVAMAPALVVQLRLSRRRASMLWRVGSVERREFFYSDLLSSTAAAKEIRFFGIGAFLRTRMLRERRAANAERRSMDRRELSSEGLLETLSAVIAGGGLLWVVAAARRGQMSVGDVALFSAAVAGMQGALRSVIDSIARGHQDLLVFCHYVKVVQAAPDLPTPAEALPVKLLSRGIELRDVWFRYSDDHPWILRGVTLTIPTGQTTALVGLNGAGKTTLVKLLCRFYDPTRGSIHWDGVDIRQFDPSEMRRRTSGVFQDYMTYDLSAAENIGLGEIAALDQPQRLVEAATRAGVHDALQKLPRGYDTMLSRAFTGGGREEDPDVGVLLSGGQWQRVALARAFLRESPDLMILDEPSAGMDPAAESELHSLMRRYRAGRTSLIISHRLNTIRDVDRIIVLADGLVAEQGTHRSLMAADGTYATLFRLQSAGYLEPADQHPRHACERQ